MDSSTFNQIIVLKNIDHFSAVEIRTAYLSIKRDEQLDPASVRRFVYEELLKLVKRGWLKKITSDKKGVTRYIKTNLFEPHSFEIVVNSHKDEGLDSVNSYSKELSSSLKKHNTELLEGLGELELYFTLWEKYPEKKNELKVKYISTKERNHILQGKINAIGELLKNTTEK
jgi:hypothetical protein